MKNKSKLKIILVVVAVIAIISFFSISSSKTIITDDDNIIKIKKDVLGSVSENTQIRPEMVKYVFDKLQDDFEYTCEVGG
ncbi:hypothetical protein [uncultured Helicobacter sp.]|uniref:hypothetical protein n=1 Tax=uncultured Helicobacter sp. TaxID=175537 RepID=UPI00374E78AC